MTTSIGWRKRFFSRDALKKSAIIFGVLAGIYVLVASLLILWPRGDPFAADTAMPSQAAHAKMVTTGEAKALRARDGVSLSGQLFGPPADTIVVFLHGVASDRRQLAYPAASLAKRTGAQVLTLDLRGHGESVGARNDVDYIGQYTDDLEDVVRALLNEKPTRKVIIAGHSMGGGIAMRYALNADAPVPAGYLLFAPNFGEGPTERRSEENVADSPMPAFVHFDLPRMIGQIMMNTVGVQAFDDRPILFFNTAPRTQAYSYRAVLSGQPIRPHLSDEALQAIDVPLFVVVGDEDQVFDAAAYAPFVSANSDGTVQLIADADHNSVLEAEGALAAVDRWMADELLSPTTQQRSDGNRTGAE